MWPNASTDVDFFSNLKLNFDLDERQVSIKTAGQDVYGHPYY